MAAHDIALWGPNVGACMVSVGLVAIGACGLDLAVKAELNIDCVYSR